VRSRGDTFSLAVKEELAARPVAARRVPPSRPASAAAAELHGLLRAAGQVVPPGPDGLRGCELRADRAVVARRAYRLFAAVLGVRPALTVRRAGAGGRFACRVPDAGAALRGLGLLDRAGRLRPRPPAALLRPPLAAAFLRGFFLGAGSVDDPARDHHLEFVVPAGSPAVAAGLARALRACGLPARRSRRRGRSVVYLKDGGAIAALLAQMGAGAALMRYEEQRIRRDVRGRVNRQVNAETANIGKAALAGLRQREDVLALRAAGLLPGLPSDLQAVARARLDHPEASLREIGALCDPPLGKSAVQRRMAALRRLARRQAGALRAPRG
jgi:DNA-binding protein WhiA